MKRKLAVGVAMFMLVSGLNMTTLFAAGTVKVVCDGKALTYNETQPEIYNDRVMVPIRETADYFGMTTSWDEPSRTMTFKKGERTIVHTLDQKNISVNGQVKAFDTPSFSKDGRTVMPVRMLAEALGSEVSWDKDSTTVTIKNNSQPKVLSAIPSKTSINIGESITVTALVSGDAASLRLTDAGGKVLAESTTFTQTGENRSFTVSYTPGSITTGGVMSITASAGSGGTYFSDTSKGFSLTVTEKVEIVSIDVDTSTVAVDEDADVAIVVSDGVTKIKITNDYNSDELTFDSYTDSDEGRVFDVRIKPLKEGTTTYTVYAGTASKYTSISKTFTLEAEEIQTLEIKDVKVDSTTVKVDEDAKVTVTANRAADSIKIVDNNSNTMVSKTSSYTTSGSDRVWEVYVTVKKSGSSTYTVYAYDKDNTSISKTFTIKGSGSGSGESPYIERVDIEESMIYDGDRANVEVYTNMATSRVYIVDEDGDEVATKSSSNDERDDRYIWRMNFRPRDSQTYTVYAENENGDETSTTFYISVE